MSNIELFFVKNRFNSFLASAVFALGLSGCAGTREVSSLEDYLPSEEFAREENRDLDAVLRHYFTPQAYEAIKDIPLVAGPAVSGYAAGTTVWSNLASLCTLNGVGRKVIIPAEQLRRLGVRAIVHEYVHQLDDMDRDGEGEFIDHELFKERFAQMLNDFKNAGIALSIDRQVATLNGWTDMFGVGEGSEHLAYLCDMVALECDPLRSDGYDPKSPQYMREALSGILNRDVLWRKEETDE